MRRHKNLGMQIRLKRIEAGMTQGQLAKVVGVLQPILSSWERNSHRPQEKFLKRLNQVLNIDVMALVVYNQIKNGERPAGIKGSVP